MVTIYVNGEDRTKQLSDWEIQWDSRRSELKLTCHFPSGKSYSRPLSECEIVPTREVQGMLITDKESTVYSAIESALICGEKYALVRLPASQNINVKNLDDIELLEETTIKEGAIFRYFLSVAEARVAQSPPEKKSIAENILRQLDKIIPLADTALHTYCTGHNQEQARMGSFIYPFGINESQLKAVERAFTSQVSVIKGPPGTGKTQTILNIIANILLRGKSVAILSNNNDAVENVYEKLSKNGLDYLIAKLGNRNNRDSFFDTIPEIPQGSPEVAPTMDYIQSILEQLKQYLHTQNEVVKLQSEIDELKIERDYLLQWRRENDVSAASSLDKYKLSPRKTVDLMAYLNHLKERHIKFKDRIELLFNFKIFRMKPFDDIKKRNSMIYELQLHYYDKTILETKAALNFYKKVLDRANFKSLLDDLTRSSMLHLKSYVHENAPNHGTFNSETYRQEFGAFVKRYPIIGSSTHSIVNSIGSGAILDYVIIDEASQQDIIPGILALGCAKNLVVVGDSNQLAHIPTKLNIKPPSTFYDCEKYSLLDSCINVFNDSLPQTLLKEHYRCHPKIIQFCNQQYYDNQLIPMRQDTGEQAMELIITAKGNHTRNHSNLRELDSLRKILKLNGAIEWDSINARGFIAPYREQVDLSHQHLPNDFVNDTVHKFQGRECDEIVFSTVLDKKYRSQRKLVFVDDPRMVNVAVSRAKNKFTLVTSDDVFTKNNGQIAALLRYIKYYADEDKIHRAPVVSAFDLLYKAYDQSLKQLNDRLRASDSKYKSEQIVAALLRDAMSQESHLAIMFHSQIALNQLVSPNSKALTVREREFIYNRASCDFVLYFKVGKVPLGVIEVDSDYHDNPLQAARDELKNSILDKSNIPLLRLRTIESQVEEKIAAFLAQWTSNTLLV